MTCFDVLVSSEDVTCFEYSFVQPFPKSATFPECILVADYSRKLSFRKPYGLPGCATKLQGFELLAALPVFALGSGGICATDPYESPGVVTVACDFVSGVGLGGFGVQALVGFGGVEG